MVLGSWRGSMLYVRISACARGLLRSAYTAEVHPRSSLHRCSAPRLPLPLDHLDIIDAIGQIPPRDKPVVQRQIRRRARSGFMPSSFIALALARMQPDQLDDTAVRPTYRDVL